MKIVSFILITLFLASGCEDVSSSRRPSSGSSHDKLSKGGHGKNSIAVEEDDSTNVILSSKVEIRHLVEPKIDDNSTGGSYVRKLTIPKNYNGYLYLAGINIGTLGDKNIKVRFKFGVNSEPITIPAIPSSGPGITPQTEIEVLVMDLRSRPFRDVRLLYDLFDYNDYTFDGSSSTLALDDPTTYNRNSKLFCRGLSLDNDPSFGGNISNGCSGIGDDCKYAYAKISDKGLIKEGSGSIPDQPITPSEAQVDNSSLGYYEDTNENKLKRCLPDLSSGSYVFGKDTVTSGNPTITFPSYGSSRSIGGVDYIYAGPYLPINTDSWEITSNAIWGPFGIFRDTLNVGDMTDLDAGMDSFIFPRYSKLPLNMGVDYFGAETANDVKDVLNQDANGDSKWMDGCNMRATTVDTNTGEHVGSCNVSAKIEIIAVDADGNEDIIDATKEVKLQLVKPTQLNTDGINVLFSGFRSCSSSSACGADECCYNKRCWSKEIVSQCKEDATTSGNKLPGDTCSTDFECASFCCNKMAGTCAVHDTTQTPPVLCSKPSGDQCIAKEWCQKHSVTRGYIVKTRVNALGVQECALRTFTYQEFGDCKNGICAAPKTPDQPTWNPTDPNRCQDAIDPSEIELPQDDE